MADHMEKLAQKGAGTIIWRTSVYTALTLIGLVGWMGVKIIDNWDNQLAVVVNVNREQNELLQQLQINASSTTQQLKTFERDIGRIEDRLNMFSRER